MNDTLLEQLPPNRRDFVKRLLAAGAAAPVIATFTLDALTQTVSSSLSAGSSYSIACQPDLGYVGPTRFTAHLTLASGGRGFGDSVNGEVRLELANDSAADKGGKDKKDDKDAKGGKNEKGKGDEANGIRVQVSLVDGVTFASCTILIQGVPAATTNDTDAVLAATDLNPSFCNLDFLLHSLASGSGVALVTLNYLSQQLVLSGPITPLAPGSDIRDLNS